MAMPEAAVHEHDGLVSWQYCIGFAWELFVARSVDGESIAETVEQAACDAFGFGVSAPYLRHEPRAVPLGESVRHNSLF